IAVDVDRRVPVALQTLVAPARRVGAKDVEAARLDLEQSAARTVRFRNEHAIAHHQRAGSVDALEDSSTPREVEVNSAARGLQSTAAAACEQKAPATATDWGEGRAGVAGKLVRDPVAHLASQLIEGDQAATVAFQFHERHVRAAARTAADLSQEEV